MLYLEWQGKLHEVRRIDPIAEAEASHAQHGGLTAPMNGSIVRVLVEPGQAVEAGAALVVLAFHVNGKGLAALSPAAAEGLAPVPRRVLLGGRDDLARHFSISAALAATMDTPLADAVGLYKELEDARPGGSGFSFVDLAADRAGARLGALAVGGAAEQERLQRRLQENCPHIHIEKTGRGRFRLCVLRPVVLEDA